LPALASSDSSCTSEKLAVLRFDAGIFDEITISVEVKSAEKNRIQSEFSVECEFSTCGEDDDVATEPSVMGLLMAFPGIEVDHVNQLVGATTLTAHIIPPGACSHRPRPIRRMKLPSAEGSEFPRDPRPVQYDSPLNRHC
jgi:hypothetical protein